MQDFDRLTRDHRELLLLLSDESSRTRPQLSELTGWARNTVAQRVEELVEGGWVSGDDDSGSTRGRPATQYSLDGADGMFFVANYSQSHFVGALTNLLGRPYAVESHTMSIEEGPAAAMSAASLALSRLLTKTGRHRSSVVATVIGLPGPIDTATGMPLNPSVMPEWADFPVVDSFQDELGTRVFVENDANLMALGTRISHFPESPDVIFVQIARGVGAGIVSGGRLLHGARGMAGEIGHLPLHRGENIRCYCGNVGCVALFCGDPAVIQNLQDAGLTVESLVDVVDLAKRENPECIAILRQAGRDLGEVLIGLVSTLNPDVLVIGGTLAGLGNHLLTGVREVLYARVQPALTAHLKSVISTDNEQAAVRGAAYLGLRTMLEQGPGRDAPQQGIWVPTLRPTQMNMAGVL